MKRSLLFLRANLVGILGWTTFTWLFVTLAPPLQPYLLQGVGVFAVLISAAFFLELRRIRNGIKAGQLNSFGKVLQFSSYPTPANSMIRALSREGVQMNQITAVRLQTCSFGNQYLAQFKKKFVELNLDDTEFELIGHGKNGDEKEFRHMFPHSKLHCLDSVLNTHFNLVEAGDQMFIWFEPVHKEDGDSRYNPEQGAFLVRVDPEKKLHAIKKYREPVEQAA